MFHTQTRNSRGAPSGLTRLAIGTFAALSTPALFAQQNPSVEEVQIFGTARTFSEATTTDSMRAQQTPITSVLSTIDNLPGVNVTEGDSFGFDDWSTTINLRGFQTNLDNQQVGITIDGMPNGESGYGGGSKANRFIDSANSGGVEVNQGTADISSRTLEALGGTLNFLTDDPSERERFRTQVSVGDFEARRYYGRYDTGNLDGTRAWISVSRQTATDFIEGSAQNERSHAAAKLISDLDRVRLTGYVSYDDVVENNYQQITLAEFKQNPRWDRLTGDWTSIPYIDQLYRQGWGTLRENLFGYFKADFAATDNFDVHAGVYTHHMEGRGDWIPPEIIDIRNDGAGPQSELTSGPTYYGGAPSGNIRFVDRAGNALSPMPGCVSSITFPYGGAGPEYDPACYPSNAVPVSSYRHTHYERDRWGLTLDFDLRSKFGDNVDNLLRGGVWYEDSDRYEWRDWHKVIDSRTSYQYDDNAYWRQYDLLFPRKVTHLYLADTVTAGIVAFSIGVRQFDVDTSRIDNFGVEPTVGFSAKTDMRFSTGLTVQLPVDGLEAFAGYAENVKPLSDAILRNATVVVDNLEEETAENIEVGLRYSSPRFSGSATYFDSTFNNRLEFFSAQTAGNIPDYLVGTDGRYDNVGGIETNGLELALTGKLSDNWSLYGSYTYTDATYVGTGLGPEADAALGIVPGNRVVATAKNMAVATVDWTRNNYSAGLSTKYVGDRFIDRPNLEEAPGYATTDFYFNIQGEEIGDVLKGFQLGLVINNITDKSYFGGISGFGGWIGAPRTAVFTLTTDF